MQVQTQSRVGYDEILSILLNKIIKMNKTKICIDSPIYYPRSIAFQIDGWVASELEIDSVFCGSHKLENVVRPDVVEHYKDSHYKYFYGFKGVVNELEFIDGQVKIVVMHKCGQSDSHYETFEEDNLLSISKERNKKNFETCFPSEDFLTNINKSFRYKLDNKVHWKSKETQKLLKDNFDIPSCDETQPLNYLPKELANKFSIFENGQAASRGHDPLALALIGKFKDGFILDCGSGHPIINYKNVINFEIQHYSNTDVVGVGQELPFKDNSFDVVFSHSVLEHVTDPFLCASEIERVLKPGGILYASVPFLIPLHGYPDHYYNMTQNGMKNLFKGLNEIECNVANSGHPIYSVSSILEIWRNGLDDDLRDEFESLSVRELINNKDLLVQKLFSQSLSQDVQKNISCTNLLLAQKLN